MQLRHKLITYFFASLFIIFTFISSATNLNAQAPISQAIPVADAGSDLFNRNKWHGYFYNIEDPWSKECEGRVLCQGLGGKDKPVNSQGDFINQIKSYHSTNSNVGADFIILTMIGKKPPDINKSYSGKDLGTRLTDQEIQTWVDLVMSSEIVYNDFVDVRWNTYTQTFGSKNNLKRDIAWYDQQNTPVGILYSQPAITLKKNGVPYYTIRKDCGNPVNSMPANKSGQVNLSSTARVGTGTESSRVFMDYNSTETVTFKNSITTSNLVNVSDNDSFSFSVNRNASYGLADNPNLIWGTNKDIPLSEVFVNNPSRLKINNNPSNNISETTFKIGNRNVTGLIGREYCRQTSLNLPGWLSSSGNNRACVLIKGSVVNSTMDVDVNDYEKYSSTSHSLTFKLNGSDRPIFCSEGWAVGADIPMSFEYALDSRTGAYSSLGTKVIKNCTPVSNILIGTGSIPASTLDSKTIGVNNVVNVYLRARLPDRTIEAEPKPFRVYEAPFVMFNGNDIRSCVNDVDKSRFVFMPNNPANGSKNILASLWKSGYVNNPASLGWSPGINSYVNDIDSTTDYNKLKSSGISCVSSPSGLTGAASTVSGSYNESRSITADKIYISGNLTPSRDTDLLTSNPLYYEINAIEIFIGKDVELLQGVILNAQTIYTCSTGISQPVDALQWHRDCNKPLRIEGSVNAKDLKLMRSLGTRYKSDSSANQSGLEKDRKPAEVITYPSYFYFTNIGSSGRGEIQSYSQAPPRL